MARAFYIESVADAAALAGGCEPLAAELGVSAAVVESWRAGSVIPGNAEFLRLIELTRLLETDAQRNERVALSAA